MFVLQSEAEEMIFPDKKVKCRTEWIYFMPEGKPSIC